MSYLISFQSELFKRSNRKQWKWFLCACCATCQQGRRLFDIMKSYMAEASDSSVKLRLQWGVGGRGRQCSLRSVHEWVVYVHVKHTVFHFEFNCIERKEQNGIDRQVCNCN